MTEARNAQNIASSEGALDATLEARLKELHTALPGIIVSFDPILQTATVQATVSRVLNTGKTITLPVCSDVPVFFPSGGNFVLTFPVANGDECLLVFSERAIDGWFESGGIEPPADYRLHDLSDGFAFVGFRSKPHKITSFLTDGVSLQSLDGATSITIGTDGSVVQATPGGSTTLTAAGKFIVDAPAGIDLNGILFNDHTHTDPQGGAVGVPQ